MLIGAGAAAILYPVIPKNVGIILLGWLLITGGAAQAISLPVTREISHFWIQLIPVVLVILIGLLFLVL